jgi:hypothetical protein
MLSIFRRVVEHAEHKAMLGDYCRLHTLSHAPRAGAAACTMARRRDTLLRWQRDVHLPLLRRLDAHHLDDRLVPASSALPPLAPSRALLLRHDVCLGRRHRGESSHEPRRGHVGAWRSRVVGEGHGARVAGRRRRARGGLDRARAGRLIPLCSADSSLPATAVDRASKQQQLHAAERRAQSSRQQTTLSDNTQHSNTATHHSTATHTPPLLATSDPPARQRDSRGGVLEQACVFIPTPRHVARAVCEIRWGRTEY